MTDASDINTIYSLLLHHRGAGHLPTEYDALVALDGVLI